MDETRVGRWLTRHFRYDPMHGSFAGVVRGRLTVGGALCRSLHRWTLVRTRAVKVYLHCWEGDDWSTDLHDHSARMVSIGLWGTYLETTMAGTRRYRAPWVRTFPATHTHRIQVPGRPCWTLVITGPKTTHSAFLVNGRRVAHGDYLRSGLAQARKSC